MNTGMSKTQASTDMGSQSFSDSTDDGSAKLLFRFAILPVILAVIATIVFLAGALISFFLLQQREYQYAYNGLVKVSAEATTNFQKAIAAVIRNVEIFHKFYDVDPNQLPNFYTQSVPFMYASGTFPEHINSVYYVKRIYDYEKDAVIAKTRLIGPDFVNFNLTSRSASNAIIPYTPNTVYWPVYVFVSKSNILRYHVVPNVNINISIGFDYGTNAVRNGTLFRAISQKTVAASGKLAQSRGGFGSVVLKANFNASNPSDCIGLSGGTVRFDTLLQSGMAQYSSNLLIKLTDLNVTTGTLDDKFLWSTGIINGTTMTRAQHDAAMSNSMFTTGGTVTFGDRLFAVTYAPNDAFMAQYSTFDKWIALIIFLCAIVISWGACTVLFFVNRLSYSRKLRAHSKRQYQTLKDNQDNLTALLRRIANQEQKTRATINALPDYVIVTNAMGKIVQFNTAFEELFQHTEQQLAEGIFISSVFFKLYNNNPNWFKMATDDQTIESTMETKKGEVNVKILVRPLNSVSALHDNDLTTKLGHNDIADDSEDYVIIARPV